MDAMIAKLIPSLKKTISLLTVGIPSLKIPGGGAGKWKRWGFTLWAWAYPVVKKGAPRPSLMPGGTREAYDAFAPILKAVSAKAEGEACVDYMDPDGAGHYVKMVHNGIEYADMQMIADTYFVMKNVLGMTAEEMADTWKTWNKGELSSYLVEITARILRKADEMTGKPLVDVILDVAKQKGTGRWTSMSALALGVPAPTITEAVFARTMSSRKEERLALSKRYRDLALKGGSNRPAVLEDLRQALYASKICAYAQGFNLLEEAGKVYGWDLQMGRIAKIWRSGCIIRSFPGYRK